MNKKYFDIRTRCPACGSTSAKVIYQNPFNTSPVKDYLIDFYSSQGPIELSYLENGNYILEECFVCDLIYQKEIPNDELMERLYEYWMDPKGRFDYYEKNAGLKHYLNYAQEITRVMAYLNKRPSDLKIFDFGMGWGKWALMAKAFGCDAYGSELSTERINNAKSNGLKVIEWDEFDKYQFHFINTEQVFEHIPDPLETLRHLRKALAPDGIIKISVPTATNIEYRLKKMDWKAKKNSRNSLNPVAPLEHINFFRRKSIVRMAEEAGLKEVLIPIRKQYQYTSDWGGVKKIAKNLFQPISLNILRSYNYLLFKHA
jgi:2-polyprenyl-3-methyl-5-hydroxy-6-metoxy-1,4-benzoquinol methylase